MARKVNTQVAKHISAGNAEAPVPGFVDRLRFAYWLAGKTVGVDSAKELALVLRKRPGQLSGWLGGATRPEWPNIRVVADAVGINANWLDDPQSRGAVEPADWGEWWNARVTKPLRLLPKKGVRVGGLTTVRKKPNKD